MRALYIDELNSVGGGDQAPSCAVVYAQITGSNGVSTIAVAVTCSCPAGTTMSTSTSGGTTTATCKS